MGFANSKECERETSWVKRQAKRQEFRKISGFCQVEVARLEFMRVYQAKVKKLTGTDFHEIWRKTSFIFKKIKKKSKRRPYVRSVYFKKDKIFFNLFWSHLFEKPRGDRFRRLKFFEATIELIEHSRFDPSTVENPNNPGQLLHRFAGVTKEWEVFYVQIKEEKASGNKYLISIFPEI